MDVAIQGHVEPGFERVSKKLQAIIQQAPSGGGAAMSVYHKGRCVVDIWGGCAGEDLSPWQEDTLSISFSTSKGIVSTLVHMLVDRGVIDYNDRVSTYWPEFAENGKAEITIRQLMCHESGLYNVEGLIDDIEDLFEWDHMTSALAAAKPSHPPGKAHGYHGLTYGWLVGELLQRITQKSLAELIHDELTEPLSLDGMYIGLPDHELGRAAQMIVGDVMNNGLPKPLLLAYKVQNTLIRALTAGKLNFDRLKDALLLHRFSELDQTDPKFMQACVPAANGMFTARSLARVYGALANRGELDGTRLLSNDTLFRATQQQNSGLDQVVGLPMGWRLGYHRLFCPGYHVNHAFGHFGFGGSGAWADPIRNVSVGVTVNNGVGTPFGDARIVDLSRSVLRSVELAA